MFKNYIHFSGPLYSPHELTMSFHKIALFYGHIEIVASLSLPASSQKSVCTLGMIKKIACTHLSIFPLYAWVPLKQNFVSISNMKSIKKIVKKKLSLIILLGLGVP